MCGVFIYGLSSLTTLHGAPVWAAGTPAALGTYPSQGQGWNPGLDFFAFNTFQDFVIFALMPNTFQAFQAPVTRHLLNSDIMSPTIVKRVIPGRLAGRRKSHYFKIV